MRKIVVALFAVLLALGVFGCGPENDTKAKNKPATSEAKLSDSIDINRANADELMGFKGIGEARAKAIIKGRPYGRKDELVQKKIVPQSVYDDIKDKIIARQR